MHNHDGVRPSSLGVCFWRLAVLAADATRRAPRNAVFVATVPRRQPSGVLRVVHRVTSRISKISDLSGKVKPERVLQLLQ